jgi:hypothetical protein
MRRFLLLCCIVVCALHVAYGTTHASTTISIAQADRTYTYTLRSHATLNGILRQAPAIIVIEHADKLFVQSVRQAASELRTLYTSSQAHIIILHADMLFVSVLRNAGSDAQSIYRALQARPLIQHADTQYVPLLAQAPSGLQPIVRALQARIVIQHADTQYVPALVPLVLDGGIPTSTIAARIAFATPIPTLHAPLSESTPTPTILQIPTESPKAKPSQSPVLYVPTHVVMTPTATVERTP